MGSLLKNGAKITIPKLGGICIREELINRVEQMIDIELSPQSIDNDNITQNSNKKGEDFGFFVISRS